MCESCIDPKARRPEAASASYNVLDAFNEDDESNLSEYGEPTVMH